MNTNHDEIGVHFSALFPAAHVKVKEWGPLGVAVEVYQMYEYVDFALDTQIKMAEFMGSKNISPADYESYSGCETCDYGSRYTVTFVIKPE